MPVHAVSAIIPKERANAPYYWTAGDVRSDYGAPPGPAVGGIGVTLSQNRHQPYSVDVNKNREDGTHGASVLF